MPGFTSWRRWYSGGYCSTSSGISGRGPTMLMSPFSTFQKFGSSSRLVARRKRPTRVSRDIGVVKTNVLKWTCSSFGVS